MTIQIPIPIGAKHVAAVQGAVWKFVSCGHCQQRYAYLLDLEATGEEYDPLFLDGKGSAERARAKAEQNFSQKSRNVVLPVPCPNCGSYQDDMSRTLKEDVSINSLQITGLVIAVLSLVPLAFSIPYIWVLTIVLAVAGVALLACGYAVSFRFDPNAGDPEPRKALGRRHSVWGEHLAELLATIPNAEPGAAEFKVRPQGAPNVLSLGPIPDAVVLTVQRLVAQARSDQSYDERPRYMITAGVGGETYIDANGEVWNWWYGDQNGLGEIVERVPDGPMKVGAIAIAAKRVPEFSAWLPARPPDATDCQTCLGTGWWVPPFRVLCPTCHGMGWVV